MTKVSAFHNWYEMHIDEELRLFDIWNAACDWQKERDVELCDECREVIRDQND